MQIQVQEVSVETVQKGRNSYQKLSVVHTANGRNSTKFLMSFANPSVFNLFKDALPGSTWEVETKKNGEFWEWVSAAPVGDATPPAKNATAPILVGKVTGSNYETAEERKIKQMYIIKQSSISNAIDLLGTGAKTPPAVELVLDTAQRFVDFVYGNETDLFKQPNDIDADIPY
jgi:hypothetical protein